MNCHSTAGNANPAPRMVADEGIIAAYESLHSRAEALPMFMPGLA